MKRAWLWIALLFCACVVPAWAQTSGSQGLRLEGWGVRVGVGTDPDQIVGGFHFDLGEIVDRLRLEPNVELGLGDDHTVLSGTAAVHYRFDVDATVEPYAGGGVAVAFVDRDLPPNVRGDDTDIEISVKLTGGVEWRLQRARSFRLELSLHVGDIYDAQVMAAWTF